MEAKQSFLHRNEFLIRRLHSLSGLIPVGAFMCVHLVTNSTVLDSPRTFQDKVYLIHGLGKLLPAVEWAFIFIPILFHAILGVVIIRGGLPNSNVYTYGSNVRYTAQRVTGMIAFFFIVWHVFHMHGWFHNPLWLENVADRLVGAQFRAFNAASTAGEALQASIIVQVLYAIGILACVYHLANGIWTMGITWGVWVSPAGQRRANYICAAFGVGLAFVGMGALWGFSRVDADAARAIEDQMYEARVASGDLEADEHKRSSHDGSMETSDPDAAGLEEGEEQAESSKADDTQAVSMVAPNAPTTGP